MRRPFFPHLILHRVLFCPVLFLSKMMGIENKQKESESKGVGRALAGSNSAVPAYSKAAASFWCFYLLLVVLVVVLTFAPILVIPD